MPRRLPWSSAPEAEDAPTVAAPGRLAWLAIVAAVVALAWLLRAFATPAAPFHENFHGYNALALDARSAPGEPSIPSSYLALMAAAGLWGERLIVANQILSALVAAPVMALARDVLGGALPALAAGLVIAAHPLLVRLGASEDPFAFYALALLAGVVAARRGLRRERLAWVALGSVLASVAVFTRDSTVAGGAVYAVLTWRRLPTSRRVAYAGLLLVPLGAAGLRVATIGLSHLGAVGPAGGAPSPPWQLLQWATLGAFGVVRTPAAFPAMAVAGLGLLALARPGTALRFVLAIGLQQGPFALLLHDASSPLSPSRHLSPAVALWALPAAYGLVLAVGAALRHVPTRWQAARPLAVLAALGLVFADAGPLMSKRTLPDLEYGVLRECLARLPSEARYVVPEDGRTQHVVREQAWVQAERPGWRPDDDATRAWDAREGRRPPVVMLVDHACTAWLTMATVIDFSEASVPTAWGPLRPACATPLRAHPWTTVIRADLPLEPARPDRRTIPVGCLIAAAPDPDRTP